MIDIKKLRPTRAPQVTPGEFFTAIGDPPTPFVAGSFEYVEGEPPGTALIDLSRMVAGPLDSWRQYRGYVVRDVRLEVDPSAAESGSSVSPGALVLMDDGRVALVAAGDGRDRMSRYIVAIDGGKQVSRAGRESDLAFTTWRIVCGPEEAPIELFSTGASKYNLDNALDA